MDYRFVDQNGYTFFANRGGDSWVDPTWDHEIYVSQHAKIDLAQRQTDFQLAREAAEAFTNVAPPSFENHVFHMASFAAQPAPIDNAQMMAVAAEMAKTPPTAALNGDTDYASYNTGGYSQYATQKYSGSTGCFAWICAASHSATLIWTCDWNGSGCSYRSIISANNHGRAYNQLSYDCISQSSGWYYNAPIDGSTAGGATGSYDGQGGCQTSYSWSSSNNAHLCNDDAAYELWEAKYGPQNNVSFAVYDSSWCRGSACGSSPSVFSCNYPNGDWNTPNCP